MPTTSGETATRGSRANAPWLMLAPVGVAVALVVMVVLALVVPFVIAVTVGVVAGLALSAWVWATSESAAVGDLRLVASTEEREPHLHNLVEGLCDTNGFRRPALFIIEDPARNSLVFGRRPERAALAITRGWVDAVSRIGLEGLLARELARANDPRLGSATVLASLRRLMPKSLAGDLVVRIMGPHRQVIDDFEAVRLTRYPPGLADALSVQLAGSRVVTGAARTSAHLWASSPLAEEAPSQDIELLEMRVDALGEL